MKRFKILLLSVVMLCCSLSFFGCGKKDNDGFVEVYSVAYDKTTFDSFIYFELSEKVEITAEEYKTCEDKYRYYNFSNNHDYASSTTHSIKIDKSNIAVYKVNDYIVASFSEKFYKRQIISKDVRIVKVKVVDNGLLEIKYYPRPNTVEIVHTSIFTNNYRITYFN